MRKATRVVASLLGLFAGFGGPEHGYFEMLQGNTKPGSLMVAALGQPCDPEKVWNLCEPALTVIPSFLVTGSMAIVIGLITMIWAAAFVQRKNGGLVLILLSIALLLVGGGLFPPAIGIVAGVAGTKINAPLAKRSGSVWRFFARLWPWPLVAFFVWVSGQFVIGYFFNDWLQKASMIVPLLVFGLLFFSVLTGFAYDTYDPDRAAL